MRTFPNSSRSVARFMKHHTMLSSVSWGPSHVSRARKMSAMTGTAPVVMTVLASSSDPAETLTSTQLALSYLSADVRGSSAWISRSPILRRFVTSGVRREATCIPCVWKRVPSRSDEFWRSILSAARTLVLSLINRRCRLNQPSQQPEREIDTSASYESPSGHEARFVSVLSSSDSVPASYMSIISSLSSMAAAAAAAEQHVVDRCRLID